MLVSTLQQLKLDSIITIQDIILENVTQEPVVVLPFASSQPKSTPLTYANFLLFWLLVNDHTPQDMSRLFEQDTPTFVEVAKRARTKSAALGLCAYFQLTKTNDPLFRVSLEGKALSNPIIKHYIHIMKGLDPCAPHIVDLVDKIKLDWLDSAKKGWCRKIDAALINIISKPFANGVYSQSVCAGIDYNIFARELRRVNPLEVYSYLIENVQIEFTGYQKVNFLVQGKEVDLVKAIYNTIISNCSI